MLSFLNKKLKFLLIVILAIIGVSFIFFGQWTPSGGYGRGTDVIAKIDGRNIKLKDFSAAAQASRVVYTLQTGQLAPDSAQAEQVFRLQTWNRLLVLAAAEQAGVTVSEEQAYAFIIKHPLFLDKDGKYSDEAYKVFQQRVLQPQGVDQQRFIQIIHDQLAYDQMVQSIASTAVVQPADIAETVANLYSKVSVQYVEVSEDAIRKGLKPTEQELQMFYQANAAEFTVPETRSVEYVKFQLDAKQAALKDSERAAALRELSKKAYEFTNPFFTAYDAKAPLPDFAEAAKKAGLTVSVAKPVTQRDALLDTPALTVSAFSLSADAPVSDYVAVSDGFVVLRLLKVTPAQPKEFAAVRDEVLKKYLDFQTASRLLEQAKAVAVNLRGVIAEGKTWVQATAAEKLKPVVLPDLVPADVQPDEKNPLLARAALVASQLPTGAVSDPIRSANGAALLYIAKRVAPDAAKVAEVEPNIRAELERQRRQQIVGEWVNSLLTAPKTHIPQEALTGKQ